MKLSMTEENEIKLKMVKYHFRPDKAHQNGSEVSDGY
jgi:hypothetical protein